jgi:hypothetical protein
MSIEIIGIDHIYIAVSDLARSERVYDCIMRVLGFRKNTFANEGDHHIVRSGVRGMTIGRMHESVSGPDGGRTYGIP